MHDSGSEVVVQALYEDGIRRRVVIDAEGRAIGEVVNLRVDTAGFTVASLRVRLRKEIADELGVSRGAFRAAIVDVPAAAVQGVGDTVVLRVPAAALRQTPAPGHGVEAPVP